MVNSGLPALFIYNYYVNWEWCLKVRSQACKGPRNIGFLLPPVCLLVVNYRDHCTYMFRPLILSGCMKTSQEALKKIYTFFCVDGINRTSDQIQLWRKHRLASLCFLNFLMSPVLIQPLPPLSKILCGNLKIIIIYTFLVSFQDNLFCSL